MYSVCAHVCVFFVPIYFGTSSVHICTYRSMPTPFRVFVCNVLQFSVDVLLTTTNRRTSRGGVSTGVFSFFFSFFFRPPSSCSACLLFFIGFSGPPSSTVKAKSVRTHELFFRFPVQFCPPCFITRTGFALVILLQLVDGVEVTTAVDPPGDCYFKCGVSLDGVLHRKPSLHPPCCVQYLLHPKTKCTLLCLANNKPVWLRRQDPNRVLLSFCGRKNKIK